MIIDLGIKNQKACIFCRLFGLVENVAFRLSIAAHRVAALAVIALYLYYLIIDTQQQERRRPLPYKQGCMVAAHDL